MPNFKYIQFRFPNKFSLLSEFKLSKAYFSPVHGFKRMKSIKKVIYGVSNFELSIHHFTDQLLSECDFTVNIDQLEKEMNRKYELYYQK
jgi:hypothetical protein